MGCRCISIGLGVFAGELIARVPAAHETASRIFGRCHLIGLVDGNGIFEADLKAFPAQKEERGKNEADILSAKEEDALRIASRPAYRAPPACSQSNVRSWNCAIASLNAG